ncbi:HNH endonuclease [Luteolibacter sp. GHJ8]|uniref:HNH endonuclease n=1 Tax=Luteolibacter rhizosphaerae TaxID=2989719 RepID=A0ABT3G0H7_9BACT|nr:HNH endonuclease [Luteolibacter rhizosphaerae]MCW1913021.1 HNH endonuclease [Luteolibacter rhizosphaerae]
MSAASEVQFLRNIQRLLDEGDFVATYKFALLQALADVSVEGAPDSGGELVVPLDRIAEKFIGYYWPQVVPFRPFNGSDGILQQNTGQQASILRELVQLRLAFGGKLQLARQNGRLWQQTVRKVSSVVREMPLWKLQVVAGKPEEFLYRQADFKDGAIILLPGVASHFRSFHGLVLRLVRGRWLERERTVKSNQPIIGAEADLEGFLFGTGRKALDGFREVLREVDGLNCFYCDRRMNGVPEVDRFISRSRYPIDLGHNFVLAHPQCNNQKRDFLADLRHLQRWGHRNRHAGMALADKARQAKRHQSYAI